MSQDLDFTLQKLARALRAAPPVPEVEARADALLAAQAAFAQAQKAPLDASQGSVTALRPKSDRRTGRALTGGWRMVRLMTSRAALATAGGLMAAGLAVVLILPQNLDSGDRVGGTTFVPAPRAVEMAPGVGPADGTAPVQRNGISAADTAAATSGGNAAVGSAAATRSKAAPAQAARQSPGAALSQDNALMATPMVAPMAAPVLNRGMAADRLGNRAFDLRMPPLGPVPDAEAYPQAQDNPVQRVSEAPVSTFSVDVDTASWAVVRSSILRGAVPPRDAVRIEEMVNYFPYDYPVPQGNQPFSVTVALTQTPWNADTLLLRIGLQGRMPVVAERPPLNLVFLVDTSGSMNQPDKLPLLKQALRLMLPELRAADQVAIVTYAGLSGVALAPTPASDRRAILSALESLQPGGGTAGQAGLATAYDLARQMASDGEVSRILLATDGDFNIGISDPEALKQYIERQRDGGAYLSVLGFGRGNLDDATMQALSQTGNGTAAYIDTLQEAQKVLVDQLSGAMFPIADDVKVQVEFNPGEVAEYRLIGYETRALRREHFSNDRVDAGEIGAGLQVTALYEVTPPGSPALRNEPSRYGTAVPASEAGELGFLRLRYKAPGESESRLIETPIPAAPTAPDTEMAFAAAVAGFGQLLRASVYLGDWSYGQAITLAEGARGPDRFGYRAEAVRLMRLAQMIDTPR